MIKKIFCILFFILFIMLLSLALPGCATTNQIYLPQENNEYIINYYNVDITVEKDKTLFIKETITATFYSPYKGIVRYIPINETIGEVDENGNVVNNKNYKNTIYDFKVDKNNSSANIDLLQTESSNGYAFYYLGTYNNFAGTRTFSYSYKLNPGDDRDTNKDMFYFNIIGTGWDTTIENLTWSITLPTSIENKEYYIYQGRIGEDSYGDKNVLNGNFITGNATNLNYGEAITIKIDFEEGYFSFNKNLTFDYALLIVFILILALTFIMFAKYRKKEQIIDVVEFSCPENLTSAEAGMIFDGATQGKDLSSLIVYWANKGYLQIIDKGEKDAELKKIKSLPENAKLHEKIYFNALFDNRESVCVSNFGYKEGQSALSSKKSLDGTKKLYFTNTGKNIFQFLNFVVFAFICIDAFKLSTTSHYFWYGISRIVLGIIILLIIQTRLTNVELEKTYKKSYRFLKYCLYSIVFIGFYLTNIFFTETYCDPLYTRFYFILLPLVLFFTIAHLEYRTKKGREILGKLNGLKTYIEIAEKDRLEALVKDNPQIFYNILPFAYVLGVSEVYIEKFKNIQIPSPEFVSTNNPTSTIYTIIYLNNNLNLISQGISTYLPSIRKSIIKTVGTIASASQTHSGNTPRGGGFSGGGFGGGGGGAFK